MRFLPFLFCFLSGFALIRAASPTSPHLRKTGEATLLTPRSGAAVVLTEEAAYIIGGSNPSGTIGDIERIDLGTLKSTCVTEKIEGRRFPAAARLGRKVYVVGGLRLGVRPVLPVDTVEIFDLDTREVTRGKPLPTPRSGLGLAALGGKLYAIGGTQVQGPNRTQTNRVEVYDPVTDTWTDGPFMPTPRECEAVVVTGFILVPGGFASRRSLDAVELFIPGEQAWKRLPALSVPTSAAGVAVAGSHLYLFGNYDDRSQVLAYDLRTRQTQKLKVDFKPARHAAADALGSMLVVAGGSTAETGPDRSEVQFFEVASP
jgi:hypothetical protein